jgi:hypothetical protein
MDRLMTWVGRSWQALRRGALALQSAPTRPRSGASDGPFPTVEAFRQYIFERYGFTPEARRVLAGTRLEILNMREPAGGGLWFGPRENRIELQGIQDEAAVHEYAHAWADLTGFYDEHEPNGPPWKTWNRAFRADVHRAAVENDREYARIAFLCNEYEFGNAATGFRGMFENDSERFAGLASGSMGDLSMMPPHLRRWYTGLFQGTAGGTERPAAAR